jgi:DNA-binding NarL/FixJ family response regulator
MKILIVDDQKKVRSSLKVLLAQQPGFNVVGEAADTRGVINQAFPSTPDIILLDWGIPGIPTEELIRKLTQGISNQKIIVFSGLLEIKNKAIEAGAKAFVSKTSPPDQLLETIQTVMNTDQTKGEEE